MVSAFVTCLGYAVNHHQAIVLKCKSIFVMCCVRYGIQCIRMVSYNFNTNIYSKVFLKILRAVFHFPFCSSSLLAYSHFVIS